MLNWSYMQRNGGDAAGRVSGFRLPFYIAPGSHDDAKRYAVLRAQPEHRHE